MQLLLAVAAGIVIIDVLCCRCCDCCSYVADGTLDVTAAAAVVFAASASVVKDFVMGSLDHGTDGATIAVVVGIAVAIGCYWWWWH